MFKNDNFFTVKGWMVNDLKLRGNELMVYALIYGFSQNKEGRFHGAMDYISNAIGAARQVTLEILKKLVDKKLILKIKNGRYYDYQTNFEILNCRDSLHTKKNNCQETLQEPVRNSDTNCQETLQINPLNCQDSLHHIDLRDIDQDININSTSEKPSEKPEPEIPTANAVAPVNKSLVKKKQSDLTPEQLALFHAAKECFELNPKTRSLLYQDKGSTAMQFKNLKLLVTRCINMAPDITADFMRTVLEHFQFLCNGRLKNKNVEFTPRALITPWIWESVISTLPEPENPEITKIIKGLFK